MERAFGILQARFAIVANAARMMDVGDLTTVLSACIILHNMVVEDERSTYKFMTVDDALKEFDSLGDEEVRRAQFQRMQQAEVSTFKKLCDRFKSITSSASYFCLRTNLVEHVWNFFGRRDDGQLLECDFDDDE